MNASQRLKKFLPLRKSTMSFFISKSSPDQPGVLSAISGRGSGATLGRVRAPVILSFEPAILNSVQRRSTALLMMGLLCEHPSNDLVERAVRAGARQLAARGDLVTPALVEKAHHAGLQVVTWTINEPEQMRRLISAGVDGIMTDYPDRLAEVLRAG